jgi:Protein of unknown function (DUF1573).
MRKNTPLSIILTICFLPAALLLSVSYRNNSVGRLNTVEAITLDNTKRQKFIGEIEGAYLTLDKRQHNFGRISRKKTPQLNVAFEVTNTGKKPLVILHADASCGCLSVEYSEKPMMPGDKSIITVSVDTRAEEGMFSKAIFLKSNAENDVELIRILGEIKKK